MKRYKIILSALALSTALTATPVYGQDIEELKNQLAMLAKRIEELEAAQKKREEADKAEKEGPAPVAIRPALAQRVAELEAAQLKQDSIKKTGPTPVFVTPDNDFEVSMRGRLYTDFMSGGDRDNSFERATSEIRQIRIGVEGKMFGNTKYKVEVDFAGDEVEIKDGFMDFATPVGNFTVGQSKTTVSLEEWGSSTTMLFMERAAFTDAFALARQIGVVWHNNDDNYTAALGIFKGSMADSGAGDRTISGRVTYGDEFEDGVWMVGASFRHRTSDTPHRFRQKTHQHRAERLLNTGYIGNGNDMLWIGELAAQKGPFYMSAEYAKMSAKQASKLSPGTDASFNGGYVEAGLFLTGETRPLSLKKSAWVGPKVTHPVHKGGMGAW